MTYEVKSWFSVHDFKYLVGIIGDDISWHMLRDIDPKSDYFTGMHRYDGPSNGYLFSLGRTFDNITNTDHQGLPEFSMIRVFFYSTLQLG